MRTTRETPSRDPEAAPEFELLYEKFRLPVYRVIRGVVLDAGAAEQLTQDAFDRAYASRARRSEDSGQVWIYGIAMEVALTHLRGRWWGRIGLDGLVSWARRPVRTIVRSSAEHVLSSLSPRLRALVVLSFYARLSHEEIARVLKLPEAVVGAQVEFAIEMMRTALSPTDQGGGRERLNG